MKDARNARAFFALLVITAFVTLTLWAVDADNERRMASADRAGEAAISSTSPQTDDIVG